MEKYTDNDSIDKAHEVMEKMLEGSSYEYAVTAKYSDGTALIYLSSKVDIDKVLKLIDITQNKSDKVEK